MALSPPSLVQSREASVFLNENMLLTTQSFLRWTCYRDSNAWAPSAIHGFYLIAMLALFAAVAAVGIVVDVDVAVLLVVLVMSSLPRYKFRLLLATAEHSHSNHRISEDPSKSL